MTPDRAAWRLRCAFLGTLALALAPLAALALAQRRLLRRRPVVGLREKLTGRGADVATGAVLVHGVSLGEVMLMRPLVPRLEAAFGDRCVLATTTETGRAALDQHFPEHDRVFWPLDLPNAVERFLARTRPRLVVLLEMEIWPYLLCACAARGIPVALVNARVSERSFRRWRAIASLARPWFASLALALGQNPAWTARLRALGVRRGRALVTGSMKADMVRPADAASARRDGLSFGLDERRPLLLIASTSAGGAVEEAVLVGSDLAAWRVRGWDVAICPRHPERGAELAELVERLGARARRVSRGEPRRDDRDVLIVDVIGRLAALYAWTAAVDGIAVVGGSFGSGRGGQNMLEAAAAACCVVVGPDTRNFPDAMALLRDACGVVEVEPARAPAELARLAEDVALRRAVGARAQAAWRAGQGATDRAVAALAQQFGAGAR